MNIERNQYGYSAEYVTLCKSQVISISNLMPDDRAFEIRQVTLGTIEVKYVNEEGQWSTAEINRLGSVTQT